MGRSTACRSLITSLFIPHSPPPACPGKLWGHQLYGVEPDIMTLAKPLAGGLPIGAALLKQHVADVMLPGERWWWGAYQRLASTY